MVKLKDGVVSTRIGGECIVADPYTGRYLAANRVGHEMMWALISTDSESDAVAGLLNMLDVDEERLRHDFHAFQQRLVTLELADES